MSDLLINIMTAADQYANELPDAVIDSILHEDGGTYYDGEIVHCEDGYQVGDTSHGFRVDLGLVPATTDGYDVIEAYDLLAERVRAAYGLFRATLESELQGNKTFGYWGHYWDGAVLCIDPSVHVESFADAIHMAREANELAVYDWEYQSEISLDLAA